MTIALIAHDTKKELMLQFCTAYSAVLSRYNLIATGTTGNLLIQNVGLPVQCFLAGQLGGGQQIAAQIAYNEVDMVLFFRDAVHAKTTEPNDQTIMRLCDMHSVPIATNIATAEILVRGLDEGDLDYREGMTHH